jgi:hypothetical protein
VEAEADVAAEVEVADEVEDDAPHPASTRATTTSDTAIGNGWLNRGVLSMTSSFSRVLTECSNTGSRAFIDLVESAHQGYVAMPTIGALIP